MQMLFRTMSAHYLQAAQPSDGSACAPPPRWLPVPLLGRAAHSARRTASRMAQCAVYSRLKHCPLAPCRVALSVLWRHCGRSAAGRAAVEAPSALKEQIYAKDAQTLHTKLANIGFGSETETSGPK